jgi:hypothetical protein
MRGTKTYELTGSNLVTVDNTTHAVASVAVTGPLWLSEVNPYLQFTLAVVGLAWIVMQMYYKVKKGK